MSDKLTNDEDEKINDGDMEGFHIEEIDMDEKAIIESGDPIEDYPEVQPSKDENDEKDEEVEDDDDEDTRPPKGSLEEDYGIMNH